MVRRVLGARSVWVAALIAGLASACSAGERAAPPAMSPPSAAVVTRLPHELASLQLPEGFRVAAAYRFPDSPTGLLAVSGPFVYWLTNVRRDALPVLRDPYTRLERLDTRTGLISAVLNEAEAHLVALQVFPGGVAVVTKTAVADAGGVVRRVVVIDTTADDLPRQTIFTSPQQSGDASLLLAPWRNGLLFASPTVNGTDVLAWRPGEPVRTVHTAPFAITSLSSVGGHVVGTRAGRLGLWIASVQGATAPSRLPPGAAQRGRAQESSGNSLAWLEAEGGEIQRGAGFA